MKSHKFLLTHRHYGSLGRPPPASISPSIKWDNDNPPKGEQQQIKERKRSRCFELPGKKGGARSWWGAGLGCGRGPQRMWSPGSPKGHSGALGRSLSGRWKGARSQGYRPKGEKGRRTCICLRVTGSNAAWQISTESYCHLFCDLNALATVHAASGSPSGQAGTDQG